MYFYDILLHNFVVHQDKCHVFYIYCIIKKIAVWLSINFSVFHHRHMFCVKCWIDITRQYPLRIVILHQCSHWYTKLLRFTSFSGINGITLFPSLTIRGKTFHISFGNSINFVINMQITIITSLMVDNQDTPFILIGSLRYIDFPFPMPDPHIHVDNWMLWHQLGYFFCTKLVD